MIMYIMYQLYDDDMGGCRGLVVLNVACISWYYVWRGELIQVIDAVSKIFFDGALLLPHIQMESGIGLPYRMEYKICRDNGDFFQQMARLMWVWTYMCDWEGGDSQLVTSLQAIVLKRILAPFPSNLWTEMSKGAKLFYWNRQGRSYLLFLFFSCVSITLFSGKTSQDVEYFSATLT